MRETFKEHSGIDRETEHVKRTSYLHDTYTGHRQTNGRISEQSFKEKV